MAQILKYNSKVQKGNTLNITFVVKYPKNGTHIQTSKDFTFNDAAVFQAQVVSSISLGQHDNYEYDYDCKYDSSVLILVRFYKLRPNEDKRTYNIKLTCNEFSISDKCFTNDDGTWHLVHQDKNQLMTFKMFVVMNVVMDHADYFMSLHEDNDLTDFDLRGEDGAIRLHRAVLAAASPVFRRMLSGTWKETTEGHVDVPGTSKHTLQSLKDYVYLRTLPAAGLEQLLLLASYYMMPDLEQKCVDKLAQSLTARNTCDLLEFAVTNKVHKLMIAILGVVQKGKDVKVEDIKQHVDETDAEGDEASPPVLED